MRTASEGERERVRLNGAQVYGAIALLLIGPLTPNHRGRAQASQGLLPKMPTHWRLRLRSALPSYVRLALPCQTGPEHSLAVRSHAVHTQNTI